MRIKEGVGQNCVEILSGEALSLGRISLTAYALRSAKMHLGKLTSIYIYIYIDRYLHVVR
jgi:hypothetical protein